MKKNIVQISRRNFGFIGTLVFGVGLCAQTPGVTSSAPGVWLNGGTPIATTDGTKPVERGYIVPSAEPANGGVKIRVEIFQDRLNSPVKLILQALVADGASVIVIPIKTLSQGVNDPVGYYQNEEFFVSYDEINQFFSTKAPQAPGLVAQPGTALFIKADFPSGHNWGGYNRGGVVFLPPPGGGAAPQVSSSQQQTVSFARPSALDIAFPIVTGLTNIFNDRNTGAGLKLNGQIRTRLEGEGKFQMTAGTFDSALDKLLKLAADSAAATQVLGAGWSFTLVDRYLKKDANNNPILDGKNRPMPDPMVDTYYDNAKFDAAKNDMAIRYRWTERNQTGSWNFKPGIGRVSPEGLVFRIEDGVDTTDDKPETLAKFADSQHPMNFFRIIPEKIPGTKASDFLVPSVKITDYRYKFMLKNVNGLAIEVSLDDVNVESLRETRDNARYFQMEADIDHLATASQNIVNVRGGTKNSGVNFTLNNGFNENDIVHIKSRDTMLAGLGASSYIDGSPIMHDERDLDPASPLITAHKNDFDLAAVATANLRDFAIGKSWINGAQKYAFATYALGVVKNGEASQSVQTVLKQAAGVPESELIEKKITTTASAGVCATIVNP